MNNIFTRISMLLTGMLLAGCASVPYAQRLHQRQLDYAAAAGAPVKHFNFFTLYSWESLGDSQLAVYTKPNKAWLLNVSPHCLQLGHGNAIAVTSYLHQISVNFDRVIVAGSPVPCAIKEIRPIDVAHLKTLQRERLRIESRPRPVGEGG
jgi:hypothetical protein